MQTPVSPPIHTNEPLTRPLSPTETSARLGMLVEGQGLFRPGPRTTIPGPMADDEEMASTSDRIAFISYVREDADRVGDLERTLRQNGIEVWRDIDRMEPGKNWKTEMRNAIRSNDLAFLACISENSVARKKSTQNEELRLAAEEHRQRPPGAQWIFPLRLADVAVPDYDLGAGESLRDLQRLDLSGSHKSATR